MTDKTDAHDICTVLDTVLGLPRHDEASDTHRYAPGGAFTAAVPGISVAGAAALAGGTIGGLLGPITAPRL
ncbi:hypothetical protein ACNJ7E_14815 [Rhodococcus sp. NM-2]|uniref:hypothetical protein n=1 Tax=Rhodococcus sp. NM-2 TaxID=3401174 RepID=UPI003AACCB51